MVGVPKPRRVFKGGRLWRKRRGDPLMSQFSRAARRRQCAIKEGDDREPHWLASEAGAKVLAAGGNAVEALVAGRGSAGGCLPAFLRAGGDAVWMVSDTKGKAHTFLGIGQAAAMPARKA